MLKHLLIKNYALIHHLDLEPGRALNIITGETGAGKSIMLGALGLLMGNRSDSRLVYDQQKKCVVEGTFDISAYDLRHLFETSELDYDETCIIRREISPSGKSRAFVNDTPATLDVIKALGSYLMDIHSQHDNLMLATNQFQINVVDSYAQNQALRDVYHQIYHAFRETEDRFQRLQAAAAQARKELDYKNFLLEELNAAQLRRGEQEEIESELEVLENAEEIKSRLVLALEYLTNAEGAADQQVQSASQGLDKISHYSKSYVHLRDRLQSCLIELRDIADELGSEETKVEVDPAKTELLQDRLDTLFSLQKKHSVSTTEELIDIAEGLERDVDAILNYDEQIASTQKQLQALQKQLQQAATHLTESRKAVLGSIEKELLQTLRSLGMPNSTVQMKLDPIVPTYSGADQISFLFSANKGIAPQPLKQVASGGEFSRLMLSVKYLLADKTALPTIIFDEIDTGISGEIAIKMGSIMKQMGRNHQVIAITHLPQIAACGQDHYYVYKDSSAERTVSKIRHLTERERVAEIAQMISGEPPTAVSLKNAEELIESS
ncbi:DNA repair protein RecN [Catalinimonas alkaloidigena]|nr:DNA repair protein RecN [Catalinimonas alkaloidigena]